MGPPTPSMNKACTKPRFRVRSLVAKSLRLATYLGVVVVGLSLVGVRAVHAKTKKAAFALGEPLGNLDVASGGGNTLTINGQRLHLSAAHVDASVTAVLDRIQKGCETHADGLADDLGALDRSFASSTPSTRGFPGIAMLRDEREGRGVVACFATGEDTTRAGVAQRLARFSKTSDLADIGGIRYVAVHADPEGGSKVVSTWSDDRLAIDALFPDDGDAAGDDPIAAPRPASARRLLSARVEPAPYGAFVYASTESPEGAIKSYETALVARGFRPMPSTNPLARAYQGNLVDVLVTATGGTEGTSLSVIESHYARAQAQGATR